MFLVNHSLYVKLAWTNLKKNKKFFLPYLLSAVFTVITFFTIYTLYRSESLDTIAGGRSLRQILSFGSMIIGIFSIIFLFYTNGFLIKQRKKELGLYSILGLEKKHIAKVLFYETLITIGITVGGGLLAGSIISQLIFLIMLNLIQFDITLRLQFTLTAYIATTILFVGIFLATLVKNVIQVHLNNPIGLLKGSNQGEREPKASWIMAIVGIIALGSGYYMAISITNPIAALTYFFIAVLLVIFGTNLVFTSVSIYVLKFLKSRKNFYYRPKNFISVSGMIYRMKQNAVGLANICILSTMVIICMLSAVSLYMGQKDIMDLRYPRDVEIRADLTTTDSALVNQVIDDTIAEYDIQVTFRGEYREFYAYSKLNQNQIELYSGDGASMSMQDLNRMIGVSLIPLEDFNQFVGKEYVLDSKDQVILFDSTGTYPYDTIALGNQSFDVKEVLNEFNEIVTKEGTLDHVVYLVVKDYETADAIYREYTGSDYEKNLAYDCNQFYYLDVEGDTDRCIAFETALNENLRGKDVSFRMQSYHVDNLEWYTSYGGLLFVGVYFGILFLMATVLIIYYKQITEGYDDRERFNIMQKVGMSQSEVKKTIHKQILMVFTLPVILAVCHTCFALPMLKKLFQMFAMYNTTLINLCTLATILLYVAVYVIVYGLTAKAYYKIVEY